jgi:hypothetical protein
MAARQIYEDCFDTTKDFVVDWVHEPTGACRSDGGRVGKVNRGRK